MALLEGHVLRTFDKDGPTAVQGPITAGRHSPLVEICVCGIPKLDALESRKRFRELAASAHHGDMQSRQC
jgi:hypothetical protein